MLYQAHRGVSTEFPENTLPAFRAAKDQGYHIIECDPRCTADGVWVLHHDPVVGRTCRTDRGNEVKNSIPISEISFAQLRTYDAGIWMSEKFKGTKVPTVKEALAFSKEANIPLKLDRIFSSFPAEKQNILFREIAESEAQVGFTCGDIVTAKAVAELFPRAEIHYDGPVSERILEQLKGILGANPLTVWLPLDCPLTSWCKLSKASESLCRLVKKYARLGIWILDTEEQLNTARGFGADIIETTGALKP